MPLLWRSILTRVLLPYLGRLEFRVFLFLYLLSLPLQLISTGSFLHQGSTALVVITAIHAGVVAATFWTLLGNGILSTQVVEDGTLSSLIVRLACIAICCSATRANWIMISSLFSSCTAILVLYLGLPCCNYLHLIRCRPRFHIHLWPVQPSPKPDQCSPLCTYKYMAWRVRLSSFLRLITPSSGVVLLFSLTVDCFD